RCQDGRVACWCDDVGTEEVVVPFLVEPVVGAAWWEECEGVESLPVVCAGAVQEFRIESCCGAHECFVARDDWSGVRSEVDPVAFFSWLEGFAVDDAGEAEAFCSEEREGDAESWGVRRNNPGCAVVCFGDDGDGDVVACCRDDGLLAGRAVLCCRDGRARDGR